MKKIGMISQRVIDLLELDLSGAVPIYIGESNIRHMKVNHPDDFEKYGESIEEILAYPDYVGIGSDASIEYVKEFCVDEKYVKVAVRVSTGGRYYARTMYCLKNSRVENYIRKGTLIRLTSSVE